MNKVMLIATAGAAVAALPSLSQAQPVVAQSAVVGSLAGTTNSWPAIWPNGSTTIWEEYLVTTGGGNLFVNAPDEGGDIIFRGHNTGLLSHPSGNVRAYIDWFGTFYSRGLSVVKTSQSGGDHGLWVYITNPIGSGVRSHAPEHGVWGTALSSSLSVAGVYGECGARAACAGVVGRGWNGADGVRSEGTIRGNSTLVVSSTVTASGYITTSDRRLKKDISDYSGGLNDIDKIHVVRFKYNGLGETKNGEEHVGVIAQELEQALPSMVSTTPRKMNPSDAASTDLKVVNQSDFTYMLINAVKDLKGQVAELKEMKGQVADLQKIVCQDHPEHRSCPKSGRGRTVVASRAGEDR